MKERSILFNSEMVRSVLAGRKTQTRRVIRHRHHGTPIRYLGYIPERAKHWFMGDCDSFELASPYGKVGDRLWVREAFELVPASAYRSSDVQQTVDPNQPDQSAIYRAGWPLSTSGLRWRPSIHMPRWASRIQLEVVSVKVQELQSISENDAVAEGVQPRKRTAVQMFVKLWDSINTARGIPWKSNPWVWVVEFKLIQSKE